MPIPLNKCHTMLIRLWMVTACGARAGIRFTSLSLQKPRTLLGATQILRHVSSHHSIHLQNNSLSYICICTQNSLSVFGFVNSQHTVCFVLSSCKLQAKPNKQQTVILNLCVLTLFLLKINTRDVFLYRKPYDNI